MQPECPKLVECIRVDGASDEGLSHAEVQYWWTLRHVQKERLTTMVTTRSSGSSYLNKVELQNGCLSLGHANTFIPSTLSGSCVNLDTGTVNVSILKENLNQAITTYIRRVNGCPYGDTTIQLYRGADDSLYSSLQNRSELLIFLKGSKAAKETLQRENSAMYADFQLIWDIRQRHLVQELSTQYIYLLVCCFEQGCPHSVCLKGRPSIVPSWYEGGPPITHIPLPVEDENRLWNSQTCMTCKQFCTGHYKHKFIDTTDKDALALCPPPPSMVLKNEFALL